MADEKQVALLLESVKKWNAWRDEHPEIVPDLRGANLRRANLSEADLRGANLGGADLSGADLYGADLSRAVLTQTDLSGADLRVADLGGANFSGADLGGADLRRSDLLGADLSGADLRGANLAAATFRYTNISDANFEDSYVGATIFADVDLRLAKDLEQVRHVGPSTIGIDTLYRSKGQIPEAFLRGAGVPDTLITFAKSLVANPVEFYSCFISYSTQDQPFADRLHADLQANDVRCWFAPRDAQRGRKLHEQIDEAIRVHEKLLLILSVDSMNSDWVKTEIGKARKRERLENTDVLFPIRLAPYDAIRDWECFDADAGADSAREIRQYFIPDFTTWKDHDAYQREFQLLLRDLKQGRRPK